MSAKRDEATTGKLSGFPDDGCLRLLKACLREGIASAEAIEVIEALRDRLVRAEAALDALRSERAS